MDRSNEKRYRLRKKIIFFIFLFLFGIIWLSGEKMKGRVDLKFYIVKSGSMEPALLAGSLVCIKKLPYSDLKPGDIIGFSAGGTTVIHRVQKILKKEKLLITKGDANELRDISPVPFSSVFGKVLWVLPYAGFIILWIKSHSFVLCLALLLFILLTVFPKKKKAS